VDVIHHAFEFFWADRIVRFFDDTNKVDMRMRRIISQYGIMCRLFR